ncbi:MAG: rhomboid family intramembrane serine protease [Afipia sp.]|nr:rhomboid family intramembrane serine protease [Afipia sp.]
MVLPLYDDNPFDRDYPPFVTWGLIAANVIVFLTELGAAGDSQLDTLASVWGAVPADIMHPPTGVPLWRTYGTLLTSTFMHAGWMHIFGNMLYLSVFGDDIEDALGPVRYLVFYLVSGVGASLGYIAFNATSTTPLVGASGAISGVLAAYLMLRPCAHVSAIVLNRYVRVRAYWPVGFWIVLQAFYFLSDEQDGTAYLAHLGGLVVGAIMFVVLKPTGVKLFECIPQKGESGEDDSVSGATT